MIELVKTEIVSDLHEHFGKAEKSKTVTSNNVVLYCFDILYKLFCLFPHHLY